MDGNSYSERINRLRGQLNGVAKMLESDRACMDVVQQIAALRSALTQLGVEVLKQEAEECVDKREKKKLNEIIEKLFKFN